MTITAGSQLGRFEILAPLGAGGLGEVYRALDDRLGREVAIKVLPESMLQDPDTVARFAREARAASALNHPNIITIYEIGDWEGRSYIAMELVRGRTLRETIGAKPPVREVAAFFAQVARALAVAHEAEIVHRDIKPENIMVREDGYVKVLDFGLARLARQTEGSPLDAVTRSGFIAGTARYMSPEQAAGDPVGTPSDIFALGITLYEAMTGRHPFEAPTILATVAAIVGDAAVSPSRYAPDLDAGLDALALAMLEKNPGMRPTALAVAQQLESFASGITAIAPAPALVASSRLSVGREAEREKLRAAYAAVKGGASRLVSVIGEPGIGKTVLVEDFVRERMADPQQPFVAVGRCSERLAGSEALLPLLDVVDGLVRGGTNGSRAATLVRQLAPTWYAQVSVVNSHPSGQSNGLAQAPSQERMKRELTALMQEVSRNAPFILVIEDVHWADTATIDMLSFAAGRLAGARVLIVVTYRATELHSRGGNHPVNSLESVFGTRGASVQVELPFLELRDVTRYLDLTYPGHQFPAELAAVVYARTEGNPLFMTDLLRYLTDRGVVQSRDGKHELTQPVEEIQRELPASVTSMVTRTIDRLSEEDRKLLIAAAVQGAEFEVAVVAKALNMDAASLEERLGEIARGHPLIRRVRERELPDRTITEQYRFVHAMYQNALFGHLTPARRASLCAAVANSLLGFYGKKHADVAARLAFLFEAARELPRAADFYLLAAQTAHRLFASREAEALARRGLDLIETLPEGPERDVSEFRLQTARGISLAYSRGPTVPEVGEIFRRARVLADRLNDDRLRFFAVSGLWSHHDFRAELPQAVALAAELTRLADAIGENVLISGARLTTGATELQIPNLASALANHEQGILEYPAEQLAAYRGALLGDPAPLNLGMSGRVLWHLGKPDAAAARLAEALELAKQSDPYSRALILYYKAMVEVFRRDAKAALETIGIVMTMAQEYDLLQVVVWMRVLHGWAISALGNPAEGIAEMKATLQRLHSMGSDRARPLFMALMADECLRNGRFEDGLAAVKDGLEIAQRTGARFFDPELLRVRGDLLAATGAEGSEVDAVLAQAVSLAREQGQRSFELRAQTSLARHRGDGPAASKAVMELRDIVDSFSEGHTTADYLEAQQLLQSRPIATR